MIKIVAIIFFIGTLSYVYAIQCYACSYVLTGDLNKSCLENQNENSSTMINCTKKYCIIHRVETKFPMGVVLSLSRSCEDKPMYSNGVIEDSTFRTYYRSCETDLCNGGTGITGSGGTTGGGSATDEGAGKNIIIPGRNNQNSNRQHHERCIIYLSLLLIIFVL